MMSSRFRNAASVGSLLIIDMLSFIAAFALAFATKRLLNIFAPDLVSFQPTFADVLYYWWMPFIFLFFLAYERAYTQRLPFWDETRNLLKASSVAIIVILAIITLGKTGARFPRFTIIFLWFYSLFLFPLARLFGKRALYCLGIWKENVIIVGAGRAGIAVAKALSRDAHLGFNVTGFLDDSSSKIGTTIELEDRRWKVFGDVKSFRKFTQVLDVTNVVVAIPSLPPDELAKLTNAVQNHAKQVLLVPDLKGMSLLNTELCHLLLQQMFLIKISNNLKSSFNRFIKRVSDIVLSLTLLPFIGPIIGVMAVLIKLDSRGPAFFVQERLGKKGIFMCIKFRTMCVNCDELLTPYLESSPAANEEWEKYKKLKSHDPRVTRIGKFLRKTSLDELPQVFNVLKGDMSLVGPRPYLPEEKEAMGDSIRMILLIEPGISGLWQVSGRNELTFDDRIKLDSWYILNWSFWLDIIIMFKTLRALLKQEGAY